MDNSSSIEVQIELSQDILKAEEKGQKRLNGENMSIRREQTEPHDHSLTKREQTEPHVADTSSATLGPEPSPGMVPASIVTSSQVSSFTSKPTTIPHDKVVFSKKNL